MTILFWLLVRQGNTVQLGLKLVCDSAYTAEIDLSSLPWDLLPPLPKLAYQLFVSTEAALSTAISRNHFPDPTIYILFENIALLT